MLPKAEEIESAVLGLCLNSEDSLSVVLSDLEVRDFTGDRRRVFTGIRELFGNNAPVNAATLRDHLEEGAGPGAVENLRQAAKGVDKRGIVTACQYLKRYTKRRDFIRLCEDYREKAMNNQAETDDILSRAGSDFFSLLSDSAESRVHSHRESLTEVFEEIQRPIDTSERIYSGLDLDKVTKGLRPGSLVILGGKTSHGKSALAQNLLHHSALEGIHCGLLTMEMTHQEVTERLYAMGAEVSYSDITNRSLGQEQVDKIQQHQMSLEQSAGFTIVDEAGMNIDKMYATARRLKMTEDMNLLIVDYLQQVSAEGGTREQEVANVVKMLKRIAMDLAIPVVALSQFSRKVGNRERPQLNQFRESGAIEQWANTAIILWNPGVDGRDRFPDNSKEGKWAGQSTENVVELRVAKNRGGKVGSVKVGFDAPRQRFYNLAKKSAMDYL